MFNKKFSNLTFPKLIAKIKSLEEERDVIFAQYEKDGWEPQSKSIEEVDGVIRVKQFDTPLNRNSTNIFEANKELRFRCLITYVIEKNNENTK